MKRQKIKSYLIRNTITTLFITFTILVSNCYAAQRNFFQENNPYSLDNPPSILNKLTFEQLGSRLPIKLQGNSSTNFISFGSRLDEIITGAVLELNYMYSPIMSPSVSHVKVLLNNHVVGFIPVEVDKGGVRQKLLFNLDAQYLTKYNTISFELVAYRDMNCGSSAMSGLWFEIDNSSQLAITAQPIPIRNDFSFFPRPFVDARDFSSIEVPFIYPEHESEDAIEASGIAASYFGSLTKWQEISFPVLINKLPNKHAIVFATNKNRPDFLLNFPVVDKPTIQIISHPTNPYVKLLLVLGRDKADLRTAVVGLTEGSSLLTGAFTQINHLKEIAPRKPYDAPYWLQTDREILLQELIQNQSELQVTGKSPSEIAINFNLAPDLFTWRSKGIPLNIRYRYSPTKKVDDSQLSVLVNDLFLQGYALNEKGVGDGSEVDKLRVPVVDDLIFGVKNEILIPGFRLGEKNKIQFDYKFTKPEGGNCSDITSTYMYGEIDGDSTLDLRGFPHYMAMPDLKSFMNLGFPFTRMADLSETAIYISNNPSSDEIRAYLEVLGAMGSSTGVTATKFTIFHTAPFNGIENKDLLIIGVIPEDSMPKIEENWHTTLLTEINNIISNPQQQKDISIHNNEIQLGALIGFESPWQKDKSAVAIVASHSGELKNITSVLINKKLKINGTATLFRGDEIVGVEENKTYFVGELPLYKLIWFHFSDSPILLGLLTFFMTGLIILVVWRLLKYIAYIRLHNFDDPTL